MEQKKNKDNYHRKIYNENISVNNFRWEILLILGIGTKTKTFQF